MRKRNNPGKENNENAVYRMINFFRRVSPSDRTLIR